MDIWTFGNEWAFGLLKTNGHVDFWKRLDIWTFKNEWAFRLLKTNENLGFPLTNGHKSRFLVNLGRIERLDTFSLIFAN